MGILHLDLKPGNVLITVRGGLLISDFGLSVIDKGDASRITDSASDLVREGDRRYLAPETLSGSFSPAADVYSLGITLLEAVYNIQLPSSKRTLLHYHDTIIFRLTMFHHDRRRGVAKVAIRRFQ